MVYLNQAGTSWPKPAAVNAACAAAVDADPASWNDAFEASHERIAAFFGVSDRSRLLLTPGCTAALSVGIADHAWVSGDRLVISAWEHHAVHRPAQLLADRGVDVVVIGPADDGPFDLEAFRSVLSEGVRLVVISAASNVTGELLPVGEIGEMAKASGATFMVDAAQIGGWMPIEGDPDLFAFAGHKGPQGPWGIGGLYVAPHVVMRSPEASCEIPLDGSAPECAVMPGYCDAGSVNRAALAGLAVALQACNPARLLVARELCERFVVGALALGMTLHGARNPERRMPTAAVTSAGISPTELAAKLALAEIYASGGIQCAPLAHRTLGTDPTGVLRVSFGPTNRAGDVTAILDALREILG